MSFKKDIPYNELPLLPPQVDIETKPILKQAIKANTELARLKGSAGIIPNQLVLFNSILLQEAKTSSEIENIVTTNDELYKAISTNAKKIDQNTKEVLHYRKALWQGFDTLKSKPFLTTRLFIDIVNIINENNAGIRKHPDTKIATSTGHVIYTPPEGENIILDKLSNLEKYINTHDDSVDPLIKCAVIHYQFEAIHPFADGNGRTGRIINILYLLQNKLLDLPILYLSKYIIRNKKEYYQKLRNVTEKQEWQSWILFLLRAIENTSKETLEKINKISSLLENTIKRVKTELPKIYSKELVELLFQLPYCKIRFLTDNDIAKRQTASEYLNQLENIGILFSIRVGKEKLFINKEFMEILEE